MVTAEAKWILANTKIDPLKVSQVWQIPESECWEYISDLNQALLESEKKRQFLRQELFDWVESIPDKEETRRKVLLEKLQTARNSQNLPLLRRLYAEYEVITGKAENITTQAILRAKEYPIQQLLNVTRKGNISCPFHKDKNPSFQIKKNNTFNCYSCGQYGDVIDLYKKLHNTSFKEAVQVLSR